MPSITRVPPERRERPRRRSDDVRAWLPIILALATTFAAVLLAYGHIGSRLELIEYRLMRIELSLAPGKVVVP